MSMPAFVPQRHEIWFTDGTSGFYVLRVADDVWPGAQSVKGEKGCGRSRFARPSISPRPSPSGSAQSPC